jgi:RNA polymerase sigma factor (sigma-70 family)
MTSSPVRKVLHNLRTAAVRRDEAGMTDGELLECFLNSREEAAFEALVRRHGPMVLGVCRRVLGNDHDAEDAFQATFLVLVRKAASVVPREKVANWLYGVACNTALKAKARAARRRLRERQVVFMPERPAVPQEPTDDLQVLDLELNRLPEKYRTPIVLCELEGKSYREAARRLGVSEGAVSVRLVRARAALAKRLARRGVAVSVGALAALAVPASLTAATVKAASLFRGSTAVAAGSISAEVAGLTQEVLKSMLLNKLKCAAAVVLVVAAAGAGVGGLIYRIPAADREPPRRVQENAIMKELQELQGTWIAVAGEKQGKVYSEERIKNSRLTLTIEGDQVTMTAPQRRGGMKGKLVIDPGMEPKTMDWSITAPQEDKVAGIYELKGDTLKFCYGAEKRPTEFKTSPALEEYLYVFRREKK